MDYQQMISAMSREVYDNLRRALELGKWPDGRRLTPEQRIETMQAVIAWGEMHLPPEERVGYIDRGAKAADSASDSGVEPLNFRD